jgi:putative transposase
MFKSCPYFITICTYHRQCTLGTIEPSKTGPRWNPSPWGQSMDASIQSMEICYPDVKIERYSIMPNHVHMIVRAIRFPSKKIHDFVNTWKHVVSQNFTQSPKNKYPIWEKHYLSQSIFSTYAYNGLNEYLDDSLNKWKYDKLYVPCNTTFLTR